MKLSEIQKLGILPKTLQELEIPIDEVITNDEFNIRYNSKQDEDYRNRAITRLIDMGVDFTSNWNILHDIIKRFVKVICPYCGNDELPVVNGGGGSHVWSACYRCNHCKKEITLSFDAHSGVSVRNI